MNFYLQMYNLRDGVLAVKNNDNRIYREVERTIDYVAKKIYL